MPPDTIHVVTRALTSIIVPLLIGWLLYGARRQSKVHRMGDLLVLEYGRELRLLSLVFLVFAGGLVFLATKAKPEERELVAIVCGGLVAIIAVFATEVFRVRVEFGPEVIRCFSPWRQDREISWAAVESVSYSSVWQWWVVRTRGQGEIRLHQYLSGIGEFLALVKTTGIKVEGVIPAQRLE